jgi:hypothetical protein
LNVPFFLFIFNLLAREPFYWCTLLCVGSFVFGAHTASRARAFARDLSVLLCIIMPPPSNPSTASTRTMLLLFRLSLGCFLLLLLAQHAAGQTTAATTPAPHTLGGAGTDIAYASAAHPTDPGTLFLAGSFSGLLQFPTSATTSILLDAAPSTTNGEGFVARLKEDGFYAWAVKLEYGQDPTTQREDPNTRALGLAVDGDGEHLYVVGDYRTNNIGRDGFLVQMDAMSGETNWDALARGDGETDTAIVGVAFDDERGEVLVAGQFGSRSMEAFRANGGPDIANVEVSSPNPPGSDIFLARFDAAEREVVWVKGLGGSSNEMLGMFGIPGVAPPLVEGPGRPLAVDSHGNAYLVGSSTSSDLYYDSSPIYSGSAPSDGLPATEGFVIKVNLFGNLLFSNTFGDGSAGGDDFAIAVAVDSSDDVYVGGVFGGPGFQAGALGVTYAGEGEPFVAKLAAADGTVQWLTQLGGKKVREPWVVLGGRCLRRPLCQPFHTVI